MKVIRGRLHLQDGFRSHRVAAFDRNIGGDVVVGEAITYRDGSFSIRYLPSEVGGRRKERADLIVRAFAEEGAIIAESALIIDARDEEVVELVAGGGVYREPSEVERLQVELAPHVVLRPLVEWGPAELGYVANKTKIDRASIDRVVAAARLAESSRENEQEPSREGAANEPPPSEQEPSREGAANEPPPNERVSAASRVVERRNEISAEVFYSFLRAGLAADLDVIAAEPPRTLRAILLDAVRDNVVPEWLARSVEDVVAQLASRGEARLAEVFGAGREEFIARYRAEENERPWEGFSDAEELKFIAEIFSLSEGYLPLIRRLIALRESGAVRNFAELATFDTPEWTRHLDAITDPTERETFAKNLQTRLRSPDHERTPAAAYFFELRESITNKSDLYARRPDLAAAAAPPSDHLECELDLVNELLERAAAPQEPFDRAHEETTAALAKLGISRAELTELFPVGTEDEPAPLIRAGHFLKISRAERRLITGEADPGPFDRRQYLRARLAWTESELSEVLTALKTTDLDRTTLIAVAAIEELRRALDLPIAELLGWWTTHPQRTESLARAFRLSTDTITTLQKLSGIDPFVSPENARRFLQIRDDLEFSKLSLSELEYIILDHPPRIDPSLERELDTIAADSEPTTDPTGERTRDHLALLVDPRSFDQVFAIIAGEAPRDDALLARVFATFTSAPPPEPLNFATVLPILLDEVRRQRILDATRAAFSLPVEMALAPIEWRKDHLARIDKAALLAKRLNLTAAELEDFGWLDLGAPPIEPAERFVSWRQLVAYVKYRNAPSAGVSANTAKSWAESTVSADAAAQAKRAAETKLGPLPNLIAEKKRAALVEYLLARDHLASSSELSRRLLVDVDCLATAKTTRLELAIESLHRFIDPSRVARQRRREHTPLFRARGNYLRELDILSNLEVCAIHEDAGTTQIIGRTSDEPRRYYQRYWVDRAFWTPWEMIEHAPEGEGGEIDELITQIGQVIPFAKPRPRLRPTEAPPKLGPERPTELRDFRQPARGSFAQYEEELRVGVPRLLEQRRRAKKREETAHTARPIPAPFRDRPVPLSPYRFTALAAKMIELRGQLAYDTAKQAERAYRFELGLDDSSFLHPNTKDVHEAVRAMEVSFLEKNRRELELSKHISLAHVAPAALIELCARGRAEFELTEELFDADYPAHYFRRLRSVRISVPAVTAPFDNINCTLKLLWSSFRRNPDPDTDRPDDYQRYATLQSIATSSGVDDAGIFESDTRYSPFEGAGAHSRWRISLEKSLDPTDVILHLRYTARAGAASRQLRKSRTAFRMISARHELPSAWQQFMHPPAGKEHTLQLRLEPDLFPRNVTKLTKCELYFRLQSGLEYEPAEATISFSRLNTPENPELLDVNGAGVPAYTTTAPGFGDWTLRIKALDEHSALYAPPDGEAARLRPGAFIDVGVICEYEI